MTSLTEARSAVEQIEAQAREVYDAKDLTGVQKMERLDKIEPELKEAKKELAALQAVSLKATEFGKLADGAPVIEGEVVPQQETSSKSVGEQFVESDVFKKMTGGGVLSKGLGWGSGDVSVKTQLTTTTGAGAIFPQYIPTVLPILFRRLVVSDLFPQGQTSANTIIYPVESAVTNAAAAVAEGALKPESALALTQVTEHVGKVATFLPVTEEMLMDYQQTRSYIDGRLGLFIQLAEEDQLLNGSGTAPNLTGLLNRSGLAGPQALGGDTRPDAIYKLITTIRATSFLEPDAMVIHPTDWQTLRLLKDGQQQYYAGGPFTGAYGNGAVPSYDSIWGLRAVVTPAKAAGSILVGAFSQSAQIFRRMGLTVEASNSHNDFFQRNLVAIRAEERLALAVYRPNGFGLVTGV